MKALSAVARGLSHFMYVIAGIALAGSMFLTVADVILRQFRYRSSGLMSWSAFLEQWWWASLFPKLPDSKAT
ncbi:MAG: hypothetical protein ACLP5H_03830 [Desulfomonilaceae bacterium]